MYLICQTDPDEDYPGESWLWENDREFRVVVDVGDHEPFADRAVAFQPDILILTHDDRDHIGSAMTFFERLTADRPAPSTRRSSVGRSATARPLQVWLPYDWLRLGLVAAQVVAQGSGCSTAGPVGAKAPDAKNGKAEGKDAETTRSEKGEAANTEPHAAEVEQTEAAATTAPVDEPDSKSRRAAVPSLESTPQHDLDGGDLEDLIPEHDEDRDGGLTEDEATSVTARFGAAGEAASGEARGPVAADTTAADREPSFADAASDSLIRSARVGAAVAQAIERVLNESGFNSESGTEARIYDEDLDEAISEAVTEVRNRMTRRGRGEELPRPDPLPTGAPLTDEVREALKSIRKSVEDENDDLLDKLEDAIKNRVESDRSDNKGLKGIGRGPWVGSHNEVAKRTVKTAVKVSDILLAADEAGATFRFFDPDQALLDHRLHGRPVPWLTQGLPGIVTIVNASERPAEILTSPDPSEDLLVLAHLTSQNRRALVTFLWPDLSEMDPSDGFLNMLDVGGAIIWSDCEDSIVKESPTTKVVPWRYASVMSAPHHASAVKQHERTWPERLPHVTVILSHNDQPDSTQFTRLKRHVDQRDCTLCAGRDGRREVVVTLGHHFRWYPRWYWFGRFELDFIDDLVREWGQHWRMRCTTSPLGWCDETRH